MIFLCALAVALAANVAAEDVVPPNFHHVHLNVTNPAKTVAFYMKYFGAVDVQYYDKAPARCRPRKFLFAGSGQSPGRNRPCAPDTLGELAGIVEGGNRADGA